MKHVGVKTIKCGKCGYCIEHNIYETDSSFIARCRSPRCLGSQVMIKQQRTREEAEALWPTLFEKDSE